jgi:hypothetical protein
MRRTWRPTDASPTSANKTRDGMEGRRAARVGSPRNRRASSMRAGQRAGHESSWSPVRRRRAAGPATARHHPLFPLWHQHVESV